MRIISTGPRLADFLVFDVNGGMFRPITFLSSLLLILKQLSGASTAAEIAHSQSSFILSVETAMICVESGESLKIACSLRVWNASAESTNGWSLSWFSKEKQFTQNTTKMVKNNSVLTSYLTVHNADWLGRKIFICVASPSKEPKNGSGKLLSKSVVITTKPRTMPRIVGLRFIEKIVPNTVEVFWRPTIDSETTAYTLEYCFDDESEELGIGCSRISLLKSQCWFRQKDFYNVPNTMGFICKAAFSLTAGVYTVYKLYVIAQNEDGCESVGDEHRFRLAFWRDPNPDPNITEVVMVPHAILDVRVTSLKLRRVRIAWSDPWFVQGADFRKYSIGYKCRESDTWSRTESSRTEVTLTHTDFDVYRPYDLCRFCVTARPFKSGIRSQPVCASIRLHEEVPAGSPRVTCSNNGCATTSDGLERNVTITWTLPPREHWNGNLNKVKVIYRGQDDVHRKHAEFSVTNQTEAGETVLTELGVNSSYVVQMVACNKEGCGSVGNAITIPALSVMSPSQRSRSFLHGGVIPVGVMACIVGSMFILLVAYLISMAWTWIQKRTNDRLSFLPSIFEPAIYEHVIYREGANLAEYSALGVQNCADEKSGLRVNYIY